MDCWFPAAIVTSSVAPVTTSFLLLVVRHLLLVAMHLFLLEVQLDNLDKSQTLAIGHHPAWNPKVERLRVDPSGLKHGRLEFLLLGWRLCLLYIYIYKSIL